MTTSTTVLPTHYQHPSALYPVVEDLTDLEYSCCPCDDNTAMLGRFPLRDIAFPLAQPLDMHNNNQSPEESKGHRRSSSAASSLFKRRNSRESSFDDEITVYTENEETIGKFDESFVLTRQVRVWGCIILYFRSPAKHVFVVGQVGTHSHQFLGRIFTDFFVYTVPGLGMRPPGYRLEAMCENHRL